MSDADATPAFPVVIPIGAGSAEASNADAAASANAEDPGGSASANGQQAEAAMWKALGSVIQTRMMTPILASRIGGGSSMLQVSFLDINTPGSNYDMAYGNHGPLPPLPPPAPVGVPLAWGGYLSVAPGGDILDITGNLIGIDREYDEPISGAALSSMESAALPVILARCALRSSPASASVYHERGPFLQDHPRTLRRRRPATAPAAATVAAARRPQQSSDAGLRFL
eukprot:TRINITY_DN32871_c0_g1_i1.p1 TRINITY_DN32871_c0_g1~~TRINITY_DN32871_c0_g1_i1.p1  ORF type:complete len:227 (+),score=43.68 TRINITY_DN32871_c0_g1_i1:77-757(+)